MKVSDLKKQYKEYVKPHGKVAQIVHHLPNIFSQPSQVLKEIKKFVKSRQDNATGDRDLSLLEEFELGKILFAPYVKDAGRDDFGFVYRLRESLWGFNAQNVYEALQLLDEKDLLEENNVDAIRHSNSCVTAAQEIIDKVEYQP